jgi:hypothetical protein
MGDSVLMIVTNSFLRLPETCFTKEMTADKEWVLAASRPSRIIQPATTVAGIAEGCERFMLAASSGYPGQSGSRRQD